MRERFESQLNRLRDDILTMGSMVEEELGLALKAMHGLDFSLARKVYAADRAVNEKRFAVEEECTMIISTQQPNARDLRAIIAVMNMIVDLERMGDQAKGIAKAVLHLEDNPSQTQPSELTEMGAIVTEMLRQIMTAYANRDISLAQQISNRDGEIDELYAQLFSRIMVRMARAESPDKCETNYEFLRMARELERFGDLVTNVAERIIYITTGLMYETNTDWQKMPA
ncbi:MAG: phosphate signaling complex protein PhoU [Anaerolineaceae bacterium]|nr:phosphate signaling complex protein PhoU [Anaerolineaceae bacterium]MCB9101779.1 phosphate signaling complex protein PhoU [Anaerolineales bacterium]